MVFLTFISKTEAGRLSASNLPPAEKKWKIVPRTISYFFFPAIGFALPLRVRALVCVR